MHLNHPLNIAIVGASGVIGETMISVLEQRNFPVKNLFPLASIRSAGKTIMFHNKSIEILDLAEFDFKNIDIALFSAGSDVSKQYVPIAVNSGCIVIDNSSCFRYVDEIPLVIPEVNPHRIIEYQNQGIIANPNCSTIQMLVALKPIYDACGISRINVATYQAVSGSGRKAIAELLFQISELLNGKSITPEVYSQQIAFNVLPHIDEFQDNGYTREEMKIVWETRKILEDQAIMINPTTVRVPVLYGHSEAIHIEMKAALSADAVRELLQQAPGVRVIDEPQTLQYPTAFMHAIGADDVFVGRIREDISHPCGLNLWVVADNTRKGAATNAIQIAEILHQEYL
ncbi:MAG: aspartate-semialdehyde dehydrogenase [Legionellales bacterium RIFCSPHIGHO2_12_FULL_42_9]|nr:MAG: aspartate-semialdehyde dehydrogenase [Legionellales bacterium RIFCSPHIGHO2_12_FULL_42_9]